MNKASCDRQKFQLLVSTGRSLKKTVGNRGCHPDGDNRREKLPQPLPAARTLPKLWTSRAGLLVAPLSLDKVRPVPQVPSPQEVSQPSRFRQLKADAAQQSHGDHRSLGSLSRWWVILCHFN